MQVFHDYIHIVCISSLMNTYKNVVSPYQYISMKTTESLHQNYMACKIYIFLHSIYINMLNVHFLFHGKSPLLSLCKGNSPVTSGFPSQRANDTEFACHGMMWWTVKPIMFSWVIHGWSCIRLFHLYWSLAKSYRHGTEMASGHWREKVLTLMTAKYSSKIRDGINSWLDTNWPHWIFTYIFQSM